MGCDTTAGQPFPVSRVSIHAPAWGATYPLTSSLKQSCRFQSTHPRGVRPARAGSIHGPDHVSIHAPAWGATGSEGRRPSLGRVSIHAPAWGATQRVCPAGVRDGVSIHAPAWGATYSSRANQPPPEWFQSTHPRGVRRGPRPKSCGRRWFQSTHPRGVRHAARAWLRAAFQFQSTHPRGVRPAWLAQPGWQPQVSIHAPAWGATRSRRLMWKPLRLFQSTHPRGVRRRGPCSTGHPSRFNPRTRVGCDRLTSGLSHWRKWFQSTHPRGVRRA